jgi:acyl-CoA dehydrogenase
MDFDLTHEQVLLRDAVRDLVTAHAPVRPYLRRVIDEGVDPDVGAHERLVEMGLDELLAPDSGAGFTEMGVILEELGRVAYPGTFAATAALGAGALRAAGAPEAPAGPAAFAHVEARGAWDLPKTVSEARGLTGAKTVVVDAAAADFLVVSALVEGTPELFVVETASPGLEVEPLDGIDPTRRLAQVHLGATPARQVSHSRGAAVGAAADWLVLAVLCDAVGAASTALELALAYAKEREQFGRPIGSFQAVQHMLVDMLCDVELSRSGIHYALWAADEADEVERHRAVVTAAAFAVEALVRASASAIQVFGGIAYTWEHDVHLFYKRTLSAQAICGMPSSHRAELADVYDAAPTGRLAEASC